MDVYDQIDRFAMGSLLGSVLANIFMRKFEENVMAQYKGPKPTFYRRYVGDSYSIFENMFQVNPFFDFMNSLHVNIKFKRSKNCFFGVFFPFLDICIMKRNNIFVTSTYYKPNYTGLYTDWYSYKPRKYNIRSCFFMLGKFLPAVTSLT